MTDATFYVLTIIFSLLCGAIIARANGREEKALWDAWIAARRKSLDDLIGKDVT